MLAAACSGSNDQNNPNDGGLESLVCQSREFSVKGSLSGEACVADWCGQVSEQVDIAGFALVNEVTDTGCHLNLYFAGGGRLRLEWDQPLSVGQTTTTAGSVNLEVQGGLNVGNCAQSSQMTLQENSVEFTLKELHLAPYCSGAAISGELHGCASLDQ